MSVDPKSSARRPRPYSARTRKLAIAALTARAIAGDPAAVEVILKYQDHANGEHVNTAIQAGGK